MATPSENLTVSRLEQLPTELIDKILEFALVPHSLRAGTAILRTFEISQQCGQKLYTQTDSMDIFTLEPEPSGALVRSMPTTWLCW